MRLINDDGKPFSTQIVHFFKNEWKLLKCGDDNLLACVQSVRQLRGIIVNLNYNAFKVLKLIDCIL